MAGRPTWSQTVRGKIRRVELRGGSQRSERRSARSPHTNLMGTSQMGNGEPTLREVLGAYLRTQADVIIGSEAGFRGDVPAVHPTRVAIRRLRSTLRNFGVLFDVPQAGRLEDELVWWAGLLGAVRDLDIIEKRVTEQLAELPPELVLGPVAARIATEIQLQRRASLAVVAQGMDSDRFRQLIAELNRWRREAPFLPAADASGAKVSRFVKRADQKATQRLDRAVAAYADGDPGAPALLHRARKAVKRHRYAVEAAEPVLGAKAAKIINRSKDLQEVLGQFQDGVVIGPFLRTLGAQVGAEEGHNGFTYGLLYAQEQAATEQLLEQLRPFRSSRH